MEISQLLLHIDADIDAQNAVVVYTTKSLTSAQLLLPPSANLPLPPAPRALHPATPGPPRTRPLDDNSDSDSINHHVDARTVTTRPLHFFLLPLFVSIWQLAGPEPARFL